jgi:hypothetical protein
MSQKKVNIDGQRVANDRFKALYGFPATFVKSWKMGLPSPGGEGQGEGGLNARSNVESWKLSVESSISSARKTGQNETKSSSPKKFSLNDQRFANESFGPLYRFSKNRPHLDSNHRHHGQKTFKFVRKSRNNTVERLLDNAEELHEIDREHL